MTIPTAQASQDTSHLASEIKSIPHAIERCLSNSAAIKDLAKQLKHAPPRLIATIARGSSDHAATYLKYAFEIILGIPVVSLGPSVASIYKRDLYLDQCLALAISQSGYSPDLVHALRSARRGGARTIALTNTTNAPLSQASEHTIDFSAGPELAVASTKSFVNTLVAGLMLLAYWQHDQDLLRALHDLPEQASQALAHSWQPLIETLKGCHHFLIMGRGPTWAIANEAALKCKEICQMQAESFSSAEILHGPSSLIGPNTPVLALTVSDPARQSILATTDILQKQGAQVFRTHDTNLSTTNKHLFLPYQQGSHPMCAPLLLIVSVYVFSEALARERNLDPDRPPHLQKITKTL